MYIYKNQTKIMILPKQYAYLYNHVLQTHLQVILWKVADQQVPQDFDGIKICFTVPVTTIYDLSHPKLIDVNQCQCKTREKKCITDACGCWKDHISCTLYCTCAWEEGCHKPYTNHLHGVVAEGVTNINDNDYYVDLDIKIRYKLSF